ncbi:uncharacterized protein LOC144328799 [Podarcis muralis]
MAGDPAALSRFAADMDGFLQRCTTRPAEPPRSRRSAVVPYPVSPSSSEDGREGSCSGGLLGEPQSTQSSDLPLVQGHSRRAGRSTRRASGRRAPSASSTRRGTPARHSADTPSSSGLSRVVSPQPVPGPSQPTRDSDSSIEDSLPVPARKSSGGKRHRRRSSRRRAKRRRDDSSSSYTGTEAVRIWMVGHSIVHWAGVAARRSGVGPGLGLPPHIRLSWLSRRGMRWSELLPLIRRQLLLEGPPSAIVIQLGENDLVSMDCFYLRAAILNDLGTLRAMVPSAKLFWSKLLQRRVWQGSRCPVATERARKRINSAVSRKVVELGGDVIFHPQIAAREPSFFRDDGVHLSASGNEVWIGAVVAKLRSWLGL